MHSIRCQVFGCAFHNFFPYIVSKNARMTLNRFTVTGGVGLGCTLLCV